MCFLNINTERAASIPSNIRRCQSGTGTLVDRKISEGHIQSRNRPLDNFEVFFFQFRGLNFFSLYASDAGFQ